MIDSKTTADYAASTETSAQGDPGVTDIPPPAYPPSGSESHERSRSLTTGPTEAGQLPYPPPQAGTYTPSTLQPTPQEMEQYHQYAQPQGQPPSLQSRPQMTLAEQQALTGRQYREGLLAKCAQGEHSPETTYGVCGIITAILLFPIGFICLFADRQTKCSRCGELLQT